MNRKLTELRLLAAELELALENRRTDIIRLEADLDQVRLKEKTTLFADVAGYGEDDTPCEPKRSAYSPHLFGDIAFVEAKTKWHRYIKLMAAEFPMWSYDVAHDVADSNA